MTCVYKHSHVQPGSYYWWRTWLGMQLVGLRLRFTNIVVVATLNFKHYSYISIDLQEASLWLSS